MNKPSAQELYDILKGEPITIISGLLFTSARMIDVLVHEVEWRLKSLNSIFNIVEKANYKRVVKSIDDMRKVFNVMFEPKFQKSGGERFVDYERYREDANTFIRLLLLFVEKCDGNNERAQEVFDFLENMEGGLGIIGEKELNAFKLQRYEEK